MPTMTGSEFVAAYAKKGMTAWEAAALELARQDGLVSWPWIDVTVTNADASATLKVQSDVLSIGTADDYVRLPLTPSAAQSILNMGVFGGGAFLPTMWLEYQIWRAAPVKLFPTQMVPNLGANLTQYAAHSAKIDEQIRAFRAANPDVLGAGDLLMSGMKKGVVVGNFYKPGKVCIFGWYFPPPAPDVFDDGRAIGSPGRQPWQPKSNVHDAEYLDYSHGIRAIGPTALVSVGGAAPVVVPTQDLYQHPTLWRLVSSEGPIKIPRYPSRIEPAPVRPVLMASYPAAVDSIPGGVATTPSLSTYALDVIAREARGG